MEGLHVGAKGDVGTFGMLTVAAQFAVPHCGRPADGRYPGSPNSPSE
jgi:hypothetical protein